MLALLAYLATPGGGILEDKKVKPAIWLFMWLAKILTYVKNLLIFPKNYMYM